MNKRTFLIVAGLASTGLIVSRANTHAYADDAPQGAECILIPNETAGPFPLDLTANNFYFRQNVVEDRVGVPLILRMRIVGDTNCMPMPNVRVNIWHCDKDGQYSGYNQSSNPGQAGLTYLRGYQITDANGEVSFTTIVPGWYPGRVCHIHFQVYVSSAYAAISQLTFPESTKQQIYTNHSAIYTKGIDPLAISKDGIFSDGYQYQLATLELNEQTQQWESFLQVTVKGVGTTSIGYLERENARHFIVGDPYPSPHTIQTTIPITLHSDAHVSMELYTLQGEKATTLFAETLSRGTHRIRCDFRQLGLPSGTYACQIVVRNAAGEFKAISLLTAAR